MTLTVGDIRGAAEALPALAAAIQRVAGGTASLSDAETIGDDVLVALALIAPETAGIDMLAKVALHLVIAAVGDGFKITPGPAGMNLDPIRRH
jgi:hypothetical protein